MTRIGKSDAQLDAEAEARRKPIAQRLVAHREAYKADCIVPKLVSRQPPLTRYEKTDDKDLIRYGANEEFVIEHGDPNGMSMSGNMIRRLSENPGMRFPWVTAFGWLRRECRLWHYTHRSAAYPYWRGLLCWEAVRLTVIGGEKRLPFVGPLTLENAALILRIEDIEGLLHNAFDDIEKEMVRIELRAEKRAREDQGLAGPVNVAPRVAERHDMGGVHSAECPACRRVA